MKFLLKLGIIFFSLIGIITFVQFKQNKVVENFYLNSTLIDSNKIVTRDYDCTTPPQLSVTNPPRGTQSFALFVMHNDVHQWAVINIPYSHYISQELDIAEGFSVFTETGSMEACPSGDTNIKITFIAYALPFNLNNNDFTELSTLIDFIRENALASNELIGYYSR